MQTRFISHEWRKIASIVVSGMVLLWAPAAALAEATWTPLVTANSPSNAHNDATYDSANQRIVLCYRIGGGGQAESYYYSVANGWQTGPVINSSSGNDIEVAYATNRNVTVLYTVTNTVEPVVYELTGSVWTQRTFATSPVVCGDGALMQYDPLRQKTVLVGSTNVGQTNASATWLWDGTNWTQAADSPPGATGGSMTFDEARGVMVLLPYFATNKTWTFNGTNWTCHQTTHYPTVTVWCAKMAYDPVNELAIQFGGEHENNVSYSTNTWAWNGVDWQMLTTTNYPPETIDMAMLWFPPMGEIFMQGGWGRFDWDRRNTVWVFSNAPALSTPAGVTASEGTYTDKVAVVWQSVDSATGYRVYRGTTSNDTARASIVGTPATTNYDDTSITTGTVYYYWIRATNDSGLSAFSLSAAGWSTTSTSVVSVVTGACVVADFDGDRLADPAVYNTNGNWKIKLSSSGYSLLSLTGFLGGSGYSAVAADFDGDRIADPAVYNAASELWAIKLSSLGYLAPTVITSFGGTGWEALAGDFDGDRLADPAIYQASTGTWKVKLSTAGYLTITKPDFMGSSDYAAIAADFDGDGKVDPTIYKASAGVWIVMLSASDYHLAVLEAGFLGSTGYTGMAADFDGDAYADPTVAQASTGNWKIKLSGSGYSLLDLPGFFGE